MNSTKNGQRRPTGSIVFELADDVTQAKAVRDLIERWGAAEGPTLENVICWTERWAWIVLAREKHEPVPPLAAIDTVNALIEGSHPPGDYVPKAVNVVPHLTGLLAAIEQCDLLGSMTRPLVLSVLASWDGVMLLYYELADKLLTAKRPELACQVFATSLEHNRDFIYDSRWMEAMEMSALSAGDAKLPILGLPASEMLEQVKAHQARARPLPAIARGYPAFLFYPVLKEADWRRVSDPPVDRPMPSLTNEVELLLEGVLLSRTFSPELPEVSPDVEFFTEGAIVQIRSKWKQLDEAARRRVDAFSVRITGTPLSKHLRLAAGTPEP